MKAINATVTRKWIKDLRAQGKTNAEIIEGTFKRIASLEKDGVSQLAKTLRDDMKLAGLIND